MKHCPLPLNGFSIVEKNLEDILLTSETSELGYIVEPNLTKPEELHDYFADYPLAPSHEVVEIGAMSNEQIDMLGTLESPHCQKCRNFYSPCILKKVMFSITLP